MKILDFSYIYYVPPAYKDFAILTSVYFYN